MVITTEFSKEAPKAVAKFADKQAFKLIQNLDELNNKNIDITSDEYQNTIKEIDKWSEGGVYRTALHTAMGLLATGTVEGGLSAGTTAYTIPKIDEYLKEQGFDKEVRDTALLALSAGIGATVGGDTASTANNVGQVQWNYLSHRENERLTELRKQKSRLSNAYGNCVSQRCAEITQEIQNLENLSKQRDKVFDTAYANCRAGKDCHQFYYLHVTQRNEWNKDAERLFGENRGDWVMMNDEENIFHNFNNQGVPQKMPNGNYRYKKFVHNNGQMEIIIDTKDGILSGDDYTRIVRDPTNAGTYNYYGPRQDGWKHIKYDVDPYIDFENGLGDRTSLDNRRDVPATIKGINIGVYQVRIWEN
ncbi:hypothetical protein [Moraxella nonliquefaciens]|uniref:hypothetical protein n=2 Tax=Moraxella nonliquefaciens TaxID=478 RepID=UPI001D1253CC|nr:hypothetical protein [Moraxella nonliquefaciens]